jgi:hypothetical protein
MFRYRFADQDFYLTRSVAGLSLFEKAEGMFLSNILSDLASFSESGNLVLISRTYGWVAGEQRKVEVYGTPFGTILKIEGCGEFAVLSNGEIISKQNPRMELSKLDLEIILGPVLVLALALRGVWSLHASAVMLRDNVLVFLGESGQGKSTLAAYLSQSLGWRLVADDILPVIMDTGVAKVLPYFPQLKLPMDAQPCVDLPDQLPLKHVCILVPADRSQAPDLRKVTPAYGVRALLGHTAGTRMFDAPLLTKHLEFCTRISDFNSFYELSYPHRKDALPEIGRILETLYPAHTP